MACMLTHDSSHLASVWQRRGASYGACVAHSIYFELFARRLAAHGKKLVRRAVLKVNVAQTWCAQRRHGCWDPHTACACSAPPASQPDVVRNPTQQRDFEPGGAACAAASEHLNGCAGAATCSCMPPCMRGVSEFVEKSCHLAGGVVVIYHRQQAFLLGE